MADEPTRHARYYAAHRERLLAEVRAWKQANPERVREQRRAWKQANPERSRELNRESMRRAAARKRVVERRRERGRAWYAEHREQERERARAFREKHPERIAEYQRRFREKHPERAQEQSRRGSEAWRDKNADQQRAVGRAAAAERRGADPDAYRRWYEANLERERARGRDASRQRSRLKALGLPPRQVHRVYAAEKRANAAAATAFFERRRTVAERRQLQAEPRKTITPGHWASLSAIDRAMHRHEPTPGPELQRFREESAAIRIREPLAAALQQYRRSGKAERLREDVQLDSAARQLRGRPPLDVDAETDARTWRAVVDKHAPNVPPEVIARVRSALLPHLPPEYNGEVRAARLAGEQRVYQARMRDWESGRARWAATAGAGKNEPYSVPRPPAPEVGTHEEEAAKDAAYQRRQEAAALRRGRETRPAHKEALQIRDRSHAPER